MQRKHPQALGEWGQPAQEGGGGERKGSRRCTINPPLATSSSKLPPPCKRDLPYGSRCREHDLEQDAHGRNRVTDFSCPHTHTYTCFSGFSHSQIQATYFILVRRRILTVLWAKGLQSAPPPLPTRDVQLQAGSPSVLLTDHRSTAQTAQPLPLFHLPLSHYPPRPSPAGGKSNSWVVGEKT